eukprot:5915237-Pyramimonas_sp.AAC.1
MPGKEEAAQRSAQRRSRSAASPAPAPAPAGARRATCGRRAAHAADPSSKGFRQANKSGRAESESHPRGFPAHSINHSRSR